MVSWSLREVYGDCTINNLLTFDAIVLLIRKTFLGCCYRVVYCLFALVLCLQLFLHIEVQLSFSLYSLLFHIADNALVHGLRSQN